MFDACSKNLNEKLRIRFLSFDQIVVVNFVSNEFIAYLDREGIHHEMTAPHTPEQNAVAKHENRTIIESVRSMLHAKSIPQEFWAEVISIAVYTLNIVGTRTLDNITPLQAWCRRKPDVSHFYIFGSPAYMHIPKTLRTKLDAKGKLCVFIGYCTESKAYRLWDF
jgi:hypothetical protein